MTFYFFDWFDWLVVKAVDKLRKQLIHPLMSARVAMCIFKGAPLSLQEKQRVRDIVVQHDKPIGIQIFFYFFFYSKKFV